MVAVSGVRVIKGKGGQVKNMCESNDQGKATDGIWRQGMWYTVAVKSLVCSTGE